MGPTRKSRSINKRFSYVNESSSNKDGDKQKIQRKRKLSDMLGPQWSKEELECFYEAYRKHGKDWKKVAAVIRNRSVDMVEAVYSMNRAYLSLPEGTASVAGFYAMMTDYYTNMEERDSEQESNDGAGTSRKPQKRIQGKAHATTSKGSVGRLALNPEMAASSYGCLSLLKKKRSGGSRPRAVGKRTPRFPVSYPYENINGEKYYSPSRKGVTLRAEGNDDEVAHEIALALAEASQKGGSPQVSQTPNRITDSIMSSPAQSAERIYDELDMTRRWFVASDTYEEDIEGSMEADNEYLVKGKNGKGTQRKHMQIDKSRKNHLEDIKEACSGTEGQRAGTGRRAIDMEVADAKILRSSSQGPRKRSKKVLFRRDETSEFDALETLANLSLMLPQSTNEDDSTVQFKDENDDLVEESPLPQVMSSRQREKRKSSAMSMTGRSITRAEFADNKTSKSGKQLALETNATQEELELHQSRTSRKKQKIGASIIPKVEAQIDTNRRESLEAEARDARLVPVAKSKCTSQSSPQLVKHAERDSSSTDHGKEPNDSAMSAVHASVVNQVNLPTKVRSRRKMLKPQILEDVKFSDLVGKEKPNLSLSSVHDSAAYLKEKLSHSLLNQRMRRWCAFEWFYSAIDYPWFAKREFVEYLNHVGLGHVPRLTRVEWGVIRSSLGKPRRFSAQFLKEEKEKLNQYRESVRTHYTELRSGTREGLPTDLARPLSVGQRVIAIYPRTREIHDGGVLTVDHNRCRVQFDRPELGVAFVMDVDCMPLNPLENMPTSLVSRSVSVDNKFFEGLNELQINVRAKDQRLEDYMKLFSREKLENADDTSHLSPPIYPLHDALKLAKVSPINADLQSKAGIKETGGSQQTAYSQPGTLAQIQAKEADVLALAELTRALDKKEAVVCELKRMNDDVLENQKDGNATLKDSDAFKKQYAAVLVQLNEANAEVSSALYRLRQRNTYQGNFPLTWPRPEGDLSESGGLLSSLDHTVSTTEDSECNASEIVESSRIKSRAMVDIAIQALSSLKVNRKVEVDEAVNYVNDRLPLDDSCMPSAKCSTTSDPVHSNLVSQEQLTSAVSPTQAPDLILRDVMDKNKTPIPSELISHCVTTLFVIQKCTERQFPPADVARILDSAVSSLKPCSSQNLPVYAEIQKCMGIIKNQILALVPT